MPKAKPALGQNIDVKGLSEVVGAETLKSVTDIRRMNEIRLQELKILQKTTKELKAQKDIESEMVKINKQNNNLISFGLNLSKHVTAEAKRRTAVNVSKLDEKGMGIGGITPEELHVQSRITAESRRAVEGWNALSKTSTATTLSNSQLLARSFMYSGGEIGGTVAGYVGGQIAKSMGKDMGEGQRNASVAYNIAKRIWGYVGGTEGREAQIGTRLGITARTGVSSNQISRSISEFADKYGWDTAQTLQTMSGLSMMGKGALNTMSSIGALETAYGVSKQTSFGMVGAFRAGGYTGDAMGQGFIKSLSDALGKAIRDEDLPYFMEEQLKVMQKWSTVGVDPSMLMRIGSTTMASGGFLGTPQRAANFTDFMAGFGKGQTTPVQQSVMMKVLQGTGVVGPNDNMYAMITKVLGQGFAWDANTPNLDPDIQRLAKAGYTGSRIQNEFVKELQRILPNQQVRELLGAMGITYGGLSNDPQSYAIQKAFEKTGLGADFAFDVSDMGAQNWMSKYGLIMGTNEMEFKRGAAFKDAFRQNNLISETILGIKTDFRKGIYPALTKGGGIPKFKDFLKANNLIMGAGAGPMGLATSAMINSLFGGNVDASRVSGADLSTMNPAFAGALGSMPWSSRLTNVGGDYVKNGRVVSTVHSEGYAIDLGASDLTPEEGQRRANDLMLKYPWMKATYYGPGSGVGTGPHIHAEVEKWARPLLDKVGAQMLQDAANNKPTAGTFDPNSWTSSILDSADITPYGTDLSKTAFMGGPSSNVYGSPVTVPEDDTDILKKIETNTRILADKASKNNSVGSWLTFGGYEE